MANVLSTLFSDIAGAIRSKSGETTSMKPMDFPNKILEISSGSMLPVSVKYSSGSIETGEVADTLTIEHGLGVTPDFAYVSINGGATVGTGNGIILASYGFSEQFKTSGMPDKEDTTCCFMIGADLAIYPWKSCTETIDSPKDNSIYIYNANATSFKISGTFLRPSQSYAWFAFSIKT
jgi:hypothetical protein